MTEDAAWLAGLFEGEGCIYRYARRYKTWPGERVSYVLKLQMTDQDVVAKFAELSGYGICKGPFLYDKRGNRKPVYVWECSNRAEVARILTMLRPYLGERRGSKADEALIWAAAEPEKWLRPHCKRGHPLSEDNVYRNSQGSRMCRTCKNAHQYERSKVERNPNHCPQGHERTIENTYRHPNGRRVCLVCKPEYQYQPRSHST